MCLQRGWKWAFVDELAVGRLALKPPESIENIAANQNKSGNIPVIPSEVEGSAHDRYCLADIRCVDPSTSCFALRSGLTYLLVCTNKSAYFLLEALWRSEGSPPYSGYRINYDLHEFCDLLLGLYLAYRAEPWYNNKNRNMKVRDMQELIRGIGAFLLYLIPVVVGLLAARCLWKVPDELFRKLLHFVLLGIYIPVLQVFHTWWNAVLFALLVIVFFYPVLALLERIPAFSAFVNERKHGEFQSSLILALSTMAVSITICWGLLDEKLLVLACVYAWGVGDAFAALVGKRFGRHKIHIPFADHHKSVEGSAAMFVTSALSVLILLLIRGGLGLGSCLLVSAAGAAAATFVEMCTKGGYDTITCPAAAMAVILPLIHLLGG